MATVNNTPPTCPVRPRPPLPPCRFQLGAMGLLDSVQGMALVELNLDGNSLCDSFKEKADYIRYRCR